MPIQFAHILGTDIATPPQNKTILFYDENGILSQKDENGVVSVVLDINDHDTEARHTFGAALGTPVAPADITGETHTAAAGVGDNPAREDHIHAWDDVGWTTYVPSNTNITVGNGTETARFTRIGRTIYVVYHLLFGSTTSFDGTITIGLPVNTATLPTNTTLGPAWIFDGTSQFNAIARSFGAAAIRLSTDSGTVNATSPAVLNTGDEVSFSVTYEAAAGSS